MNVEKNLKNSYSGDQSKSPGSHLEPHYGCCWFPQSFLYFIRLSRLVGLATTGHIRSLMIFSVHVVSVFPFVKIY